VKSGQSTDAFDEFWSSANKPATSALSIPADLHGAIMALAPEDRPDRSKVNAAVSRARDPSVPHERFYENGN
jgi:hypothetical protein